jgi:hypothetical protein
MAWFVLVEIVFFITVLGYDRFHGLEGRRIYDWTAFKRVSKIALGNMVCLLSRWLLPENSA